MSGDLLPLFPLELVLLPHAPLPLHIFEDRYREMIGECLSAETEFGVVQAKGNGILRQGCTAYIESVLKRYDDGRMDIMTFGHRRFELLEVNNDRAFLRGEVRFFDDESFETASLDVRRAANLSYRELEKLAGQEEETLDLDDPELSFHLARISDDLDFRQTLLGVLNEADRMNKLAEHLKDLLVRRRIRESMQRVVQTNGHSRHLGDLGSHS